MEKNDASLVIFARLRVRSIVLLFRKLRQKKGGGIPISSVLTFHDALCVVFAKRLAPPTRSN